MIQTQEQVKPRCNNLVARGCGVRDGQLDEARRCLLDGILFAFASSGLGNSPTVSGHDHRQILGSFHCLTEARASTSSQIEYEQRTKFVVWPMVKIPMLVLQSRSISFYIFRSMLGGTISFPLGLRPTLQTYYSLSRFTALESGLEYRFPTNLHSNTTMLISLFGGHHLILQVKRMISGNSDRR